MRSVWIGSTFALLLMATPASADLACEWGGTASAAGTGTFQMSFDSASNCDLVQHQLETMLQLTPPGAKVETITPVASSSNVCIHQVGFAGAPSGETVQGCLPVDVVDLFTPGEDLRVQRRGFFLLGGLGALAVLGGDGDAVQGDVIGLEPASP